MRLLYLEGAFLLIVFQALWGYLWLPRSKRQQDCEKEEITRPRVMWISIYIRGLLGQLFWSGQFLASGFRPRHLTANHIIEFYFFPFYI
jgi:methane/ammonia monooxygenase subunit C